MVTSVPTEPLVGLIDMLLEALFVELLLLLEPSLSPVAQDKANMATRLITIEFSFMSTP